MLILTRRPGEGIVLNHGEIEITVMKNSHQGRVCLGIIADRSIDIWRSEIYRKIRYENEYQSRLINE